MGPLLLDICIKTFCPTSGSSMFFWQFQLFFPFCNIYCSIRAASAAVESDNLVDSGLASCSNMTGSGGSSFIIETLFSSSVIIIDPTTLTKVLTPALSRN